MQTNMNKTYNWTDNRLIDLYQERPYIRIYKTPEIFESRHEMQGPSDVLKIGTVAKFSIISSCE